MRLMVVLLLSFSCNEDPANDAVHLSWRFIDGRGCDLAGVVDIIVVMREGGSSPRRTFRCFDGLAPDRFQVVEAPDLPVSFVLEGRSITGALLYRGDLLLEADSPQPRVVTLRFVGGQGFAQK